MEDQGKVVADFFEAQTEKIYLLIGREEASLYEFVEDCLTWAAQNENVLPFVYEIWDGEHSRHFLYRWLTETVNGRAYRGHGSFSALLEKDSALGYRLPLLIEKDIRPLEIRFLEAIRFLSQVLAPEQRLVLSIVPRTTIHDQVFADFLRAVLQVLPPRVKMLVSQDEGDVLVGQADFSPSNRLVIEAPSAPETARRKEWWNRLAGAADLTGELLRVLAYLVHPATVELLASITGKAEGVLEKVLHSPELERIVEWRAGAVRLAYPRLYRIETSGAAEGIVVAQKDIAYHEARLSGGAGEDADVLYHSLALSRLDAGSAVAVHALHAYERKLALGGSDLCELELASALELLKESEDPQLAALHLALGEVREGRQRFDEAVSSFAAAAGILRDKGPSPELVRALERQGTAAFAKRDTDAAKEVLAEALQAAREMKRTDLEADLTSQVAYIHYSLRDFKEAARLYELARELFSLFAAAEPAAGRRGEAAQWANLGHTAYATGDFKKSEEYHRTAMGVYESLGEGQAVANQWGYVGHVLFAAGAFDGAVAAYQEAITAHEKAGEPHKTAQRYASLGYTRYAQRKLEEARDFFTQALDRYRNLGDPEGEAAQLSNLGLIAGDRGEFDEAASFFTQAAAMYRELGDPMAETSQLSRLGHVRRGQGRYEEAEGHYKEALERYSTLRYTLGQADTETDLGKMYAEREEWQKAEDSFGRAVAMYGEVGHKEKETMSHVLTAQIQRAREKSDAAMASLDRALELSREAGDARVAATILAQMGLVRHEQKNHGEAERLYEEARREFSNLKDGEGEANALSNLGTLYYETERFDEARQAYERALSLLRTLRHGLGLVGVLQNISHVYEKQEKYSEANASLKEARQICEHYEMTRDVEDIDERLKSLNTLAEASLQRLRTELFPGLPSPAVKKGKKTSGPGRNDPCPCGSGKKYKKCCGA